MNINNVGKKSKNALLYLLIASLFFSPYFTPPTIIGTEGILRLDQVLLPTLAIAILVTTFPKIQITGSYIGFFFVLITTTVFLSLIYGVTVLSHGFRVNDLFDIIIWASYTIIFFLAAAGISTKQVERSILIIALGTIYVSVLGLLQIFDLWFVVDVFDTVYGPGKYEMIGRIDSISFNPNVFAQFLLLPTLIFISFLARTVILNFRTGSETDRLNRLPAVIMITTFLAITNIYYTYSRTILVVLVLGILTIVLLTVCFAPVSSRIKRTFVFMTIMTTIAVLGSFVLLGGSGRYTELLNIAEDSSLLIRVERWVYSIPVILESPIIGHGPTEEGYLQADIPIIDSGILGWWYHYGAVGVSAFLALLTLIAKYGLNTLSEQEVFYSDNYTWPFALGITAYISVIPIMWITTPVPRYRRAFTLFLVCIVLLVSLYHKETAKLIAN